MVPMGEATSTGQRCRPPEGLPLVGRPMLDGWVSGPDSFGEGGLSTVMGKLSCPWGLFFKTTSPLGDEVPRSWWPALGPLACLVGGSSWPLGPLFKLFIYIWILKLIIHVLGWWSTRPPGSPPLVSHMERTLYLSMTSFFQRLCYSS